MLEFIKKLCLKAIIEENLNLHKQINIDNINISKSNNNKINHYQFNDIMKISKKINENNLTLSKKIACRISKYIINNEISINISKPGFINFKLNEDFLNYKIKTLFKNINFKIKNKKKNNIIIDYSSPNIAKNMHVGHLRSTLIGECLSNILTLFGNKIIRINHLGDWGTQFGMLISYIKELYENKKFKSIKLTLKNLSNYYKISQEKYLKDNIFKKKSKEEVINLQKKNLETYNIWKIITKISKKEYNKIYKLLKIKIIYKGESFYNELLNPIIKYIKKKNLIIESDNAICIQLDGFKNKLGLSLPTIIQKSDGGFNYMTTDVAALYYRIKYNKANIIIYITDIGQKDHFEMLFKISEKININKINTKLIHIPFGLMLTENNKKIKTRSGNSEKLIDLIKKSIKITQKITKNSKKKSKIIGINTIKYSELSNKIEKNYIFDYNKVFQYNGKTATFIMYAYSRIESILTKIKKYNIKKNLVNYKIKTENKTETDLIIQILQFEDALDKTIENLNTNIITTYIYDLAEKFHSFFHDCNIIKSEFKYSRIELCNITKKIFKNCFQIIGMSIIKKM